MISYQDFITAKEKIKAEIERRNNYDPLLQGKRLGDYALAEYDYILTPANGQPLKEEHYTKLLTPLKEIDSTLYPRDSFMYDVTQIITLINTLAAVPKDEQVQGSSGCNSVCAGLCVGQCIDSCTGSCGVSCTVSCGVTCSTTCGGSCTTGCYGACKNGCKTGCSGGCGTGCYSSCGGNCYGRLWFRMSKWMC